MTSIRKYQQKDYERVEQICIGTAPKQLAEKAWGRKLLLTVFCHYYIEQEPEHCFVAVNDADEAVGYVLCAVDFPVWEKKFTEIYLKKAKNPVTKYVGKGTIDTLRAFAAKYPAHLHIDIDAEYQRQGLGTKLIDALREHLAEQGVQGLMFCVGSDNENGRKFYQKYGFSVLERQEKEIVMGMQL